MEERNIREALVKHINDIDRDVCWWYVLPAPQKKQGDMFAYLFPSTYSAFDAHVSIMNLFFQKWVGIKSTVILAE